jgi:hypothetical protein
MIRRAILLFALVVASSAHAQETDADRLFREGQEAMATKDYASACAKFAASLQLEPGIGTRLWLADCYEQQGRLATAWRVFREAAAAATEAKDSRASVAESRAVKLEPKIAKIVVRVIAAPKDFELRLDGVRVQWSAPLFVDRGRHELKASNGFEKVVDVDADGKSYDVTIDLTPKTTPAEQKTSAAWPIAGWSMLGVGAVGLGVGGYLGLRAKSQYDDATVHCPSWCDSEGYDARNSAIRTANASTVFFVAGGVLVAAGVTVLIVAPKAHRESVALQLSPTSFALTGAF